MSRITTSEPDWLSEVAPYQDIVLAGQTALAGRRDCAGRWELIAPHLPHTATILDIGSNFGWFGLQACAESPERIVASVEADEESALVQRRVLESHQHQRICLLTARAGAGLARRFALAGQRFDAVLCLNVLHWIRDHRVMLSELAAISDRLFIEQPDPRETGAGVERLRLEIGPTAAYLAELFPDRPRVLLGRLPSHRDCPYPRELWMVDALTTAREPRAACGLDVAALLDLSPAWPPRSWWQEQMDATERLLGEPAEATGSLHFTPRGLTWHSPTESQSMSLTQLRRRVRNVPETGLFSVKQRLWRSLRRTGGRVLRRLRLRA